MSWTNFGPSRLGAGVLVSIWLAVACGGSATAPAAPEPTPAPELAPEPAPAPEPPPDAATPAADDASEPEPSSEAPAPSETPAEETRQIRYVVNPEGLRVRVAGVELVPRAELVARGGSVTIKVKVEARSEDGQKHSLLAPSGKELAFAGTVRRADGSEEKFSDEREGDRELVLAEGKEVALTRTFPEKGMKPLKSGDEVELAVGLWGLGDDASSRRAVRGLCKVSLTYPRKKAKVKVTPPDGVAKP